MITPIELVIFDCDGVLVDSERIAVRVYVALGAELGWPLTEAEVIEKFIGRSIVSNFEQITSRVGPSRAALWQERFGQLHRAAVDAELTPVDGILEVLDTLTLPSCVASGRRHHTMRHTLGHTGIYPYFGEGRIFSASEVAHGKPAPDLFLHAAKQMGVNPSACIVVEDSKIRDPGTSRGRHARPWIRRRTHTRAMARRTEHHGLRRHARAPETPRRSLTDHDSARYGLHHTPTSRMQHPPTSPSRTQHP
jgi:HAD superfamily hydrolase (TIGR01509 family)